MGMDDVAVVRQTEQGTALVLATFQLRVSVFVNLAQLYSFIVLGFVTFRYPLMYLFLFDEFESGFGLFNFDGSVLMYINFGTLIQLFFK